MSAPRPKRVLVVDDNTESAEALKEIVELAGHIVVTAADPVEALRRVEQFTPDVCILDIELPIMDGYELGAHLREIPLTKACVLVALTGYGYAHDVRRSRDAGFAHHLVKPVDVERLTRILDEVEPSGRLD